jgi:hypothetical protein
MSRISLYLTHPGLTCQQGSVTEAELHWTMHVTGAPVIYVDGPHSGQVLMRITS